MSHEMFLAEDYFGKTRNIYEAIMVISRRSRQVGEEQRKEMDAYLSQVEMQEKFSEEEDGMIEDRAVPHEPVLRFEKPTVLALREMIADKLEVTRTMEIEDSIPGLDSESEPRVPFPARLNLFEEDAPGSDEGI